VSAGRREKRHTVLDLHNYLIILQSDEPVKSRRKLFSIADLEGSCARDECDPPNFYQSKPISKENYEE
jgi:hypothetical protein